MIRTSRYSHFANPYSLGAPDLSFIMFRFHSPTLATRDFGHEVLQIKFYLLSRTMTQELYVELLKGIC